MFVRFAQICVLRVQVAQEILKLRIFIIDMPLVRVKACLVVYCRINYVAILLAVFGWTILEFYRVESEKILEANKLAKIKLNLA